MQRWHVNSLGTAVSETVATVTCTAACPLSAVCSEQLAAFQDSRNYQRSRSRDIHLFPINNPTLDTDRYLPLPPWCNIKKHRRRPSCKLMPPCIPYGRAHITLSRHQSHNITDNAGHQQTRLLMLAISRWLRVWGAAVRHLPSILRNRWAALTARVSRSMLSCTNARLTRALLAATGHIHSNSYTNPHMPTRRPPLDQQCRSEIVISTTVICRLKDPDRVPSCRPPHYHTTVYTRSLT